MWETLDTENVFLMYLQKNNNLADKEFARYNTFSSKNPPGLTALSASLFDVEESERGQVEIC